MQEVKPHEVHKYTPIVSNTAGLIRHALQNTRFYLYIYIVEIKVYTKDRS